VLEQRAHHCAERDQESAHTEEEDQRERERAGAGEEGEGNGKAEAPAQDDLPLLAGIMEQDEPRGSDHEPQSRSSIHDVHP
jgi:hypothetical protein